MSLEIKSSSDIKYREFIHDDKHKTFNLHNSKLMCSSFCLCSVPLSSAKSVLADQMNLKIVLCDDIHSDSIIGSAPKFVGLARERNDFNQPKFSIHAVTDEDLHSSGAYHDKFCK
jgi:hypothetical protein